jgi:hypothetical protein
VLLCFLVAAIVLWNTVYLQRAVQALADDGQAVDEIRPPVIRRRRGPGQFASSAATWHGLDPSPTFIKQDSSSLKYRAR